MTWSVQWDVKSYRRRSICISVRKSWLLFTQKHVHICMTWSVHCAMWRVQKCRLGAIDVALFTFIWNYSLKSISTCMFSQAHNCMTWSGIQAWACNAPHSNIKTINGTFLSSLSCMNLVTGFKISLCKVNLSQTGIHCLVERRTQWALSISSSADTQGIF